MNRIPYAQNSRSQRFRIRESDLQLLLRTCSNALRRFQPRQRGKSFPSSVIASVIALAQDGNRRE
jgi:hypothetical protein